MIRAVVLSSGVKLSDEAIVAKYWELHTELRHIRIGGSGYCSEYKAAEKRLKAFCKKYKKVLDKPSRENEAKPS